MLVVIVGEFDSDNMGDQLIGEGHAALFDGLGFDIILRPLEPGRRSANNVPPVHGRIGVLVGAHRVLYQRSTAYRHFVESIKHIREREVYRAYARETLQGADALVIGGGQLLSDGTLRMLHRLDHLTAMACGLGIPVVAFGTGVSPGRTPLSRRLLRRVLARMKERNRFRDQTSMDTARSLCPELRLAPRPTPDCAIAGVAEKATLHPDARLVGIAPMSPRILSRVGVRVGQADKWWSDIIRNLIQQGSRPVLFSTGVYADAQYAAEIQKLLRESGTEVALLPRPASTSELIAQLVQMKNILAQRLHASISFYAVGGVPASASWDSKVAAFYSQISLPNRLFRVGEGDPAHIASLLVSSEVPSVDRAVLAEESRVAARACMEDLIQARKERHGSR